MEVPRHVGETTGGAPSATDSKLGAPVDGPVNEEVEDVAPATFRQTVLEAHTVVPTGRLGPPSHVVTAVVAGVVAGVTVGHTVPVETADDDARLVVAGPPRAAA